MTAPDSRSTEPTAAWPVRSATKEQKEVLGKMIAIYRGTPTECTKCH